MRATGFEPTTLRSPKHYLDRLFCWITYLTVLYKLTTLANRFGWNGVKTGKKIKIYQFKTSSLSACWTQASIKECHDKRYWVFSSIEFSQSSNVVGPSGFSTLCRSLCGCYSRTFITWPLSVLGAIRPVHCHSVILQLDVRCLKQHYK